MFISDPGSRILDFFTCRVQIQGSKKHRIPGSATLVTIRVFHCIKRWLLYVCFVEQAVEQAVEQERRRTEGEWRRIEDDLARMEEERLRERSGLSDIYYILYLFSFVARNLQTFATVWPCAIILLSQILPKWWV
jgi:hypothetical protein